MSNKVKYSFGQSPLYLASSTQYKLAQRGLAGLHGDHDNASLAEIKLIQTRVENLVRNTDLGKSAHRNTVKARKEIKTRWVGENKRKHLAMSKLWEQFFLSPNKDGYGDLSTTYAAINSSIVIYGCAFVHFSIVRKSNKNTVPLKLELINPKLHAVEFTRPQEGIFNGIKFSNSKPVSYYFHKSYKEQQTFTTEINTNYNFNFIEISADELCHIFIRDLPGQWLAVPELSASLLSIYNNQDLTDATVNKQIVSQAVNYVIRNKRAVALPGIGSATIVTDRKSEESKLVMQTTGTHVVYLEPEEILDQVQSADVGNGLDTLIKALKTDISAGLQIPYHQLTGDTSGLNFSSIRAINLMVKDEVSFFLNTYMIPLFTDRLTERFKSLAVIYQEGLLDAKPINQLPKFNTTDDLKDTQNDVLSIGTGLNTAANVWAERDITLDEILESKQTLEDAGLWETFAPNKADNKPLSQTKNVKANKQTTSN